MAALRLVLVNLIGLLSCLTLIELGFGDWFDGSRIHRLLVPRNVDEVYDVTFLYRDDRKQIRYRRDEYGLRGSYERPDRIGILTVGGSTTDQHYLDEDDTWQAALARCLTTAGKPMSVVNAGVNGQSTWGHLLAFDWWFPEIPKLRPRYILFFVGINDLWMGRRDYDVFEEKYARHDIWDAIEERSAFWHMSRTLEGMYLAHVKYGMTHRRIEPTSIAWTDKPLLAGHEVFMRERKVAYGHRLGLLAQRTRELGAKPIFVTQGALEGRGAGGRVMGSTTVVELDRPVNGVDLYFLRRILQRETMRKCAEVNGICLDLAAEVPLEQGVDVYDFTHHTPRGAAKVGAYMCRGLLSRGVP